MIYIACGALLLIVYVVYLQLTKAAKRRELTARLRVLLVEIEPAESSFISFTSPTAGYFANYTLQTWQNRHREIFEEVNCSPFRASGLSPAEKATMQSFLDHYQRSVSLRETFNAGFVPRELARYYQLFSCVEGRSLDVQQHG